MFFLAGAASSVLDLLGSLQDTSGSRQKSAASAAMSSPSAFDVPAATTAASGTAADAAATSAGPAGNLGGCWSCPDIMSTLLSAQNQAATGAGGADAAGADMPLGTGLSFSWPLSWPSDGGGSPTGAEFGSGAVNPLGRLINLQAKMFAAATAGRNLSMTA